MTQKIENLTESESQLPIEKSNKKKNKYRSKESFEVDARFTLRLDTDMAEDLANVLLTHAGDDPRFFALAKQIKKEID